MLKRRNIVLTCKMKMAICFSTTLNNQMKIEQKIDPHQITIKNVKKLASLIRNAKYPILFTGAGISTSVGIPDYRSGPQTVVKTGAGMWNRTQQEKNEVRKKNFLQHLQPSLTHMAIKTLLTLRTIPFLVSQNTDGLHLRSGVNPQQMSQLHGNRNLQKCLNCKIVYFRDYRTLSQDFGRDNKSHLTGRKCENCGGALTDSIIYFGQKLPPDQLKKAYTHAYNSDLCICIGSSLTVKPSSNVPAIVHQRQGKLAIINIQKTPFDQFSQVKIHDFSDKVMGLLMQELGISVQKFRFQHFLEIRSDSSQSGFIIVGKNQHWQNFSFIKQISYQTNKKDSQYRSKETKLSDGPIIRIPSQAQYVTLHFYGDNFDKTTNIKKPMKFCVEQLKQKLNNRRFNDHQKIKIVFSRESGKWHIQDYDYQLQ